MKAKRALRLVFHFPSLLTQQMGINTYKSRQENFLLFGSQPFNSSLFSFAPFITYHLVTLVFHALLSSRAKKKKIKEKEKG
jgi:hypothetical protein